MITGEWRSRLHVTKIAAHLKAVPEGGADPDITGAAPLESAGPDDISFVGNRKAAALAAESRAGCLLVPPDFPIGRTLIRVADPRAAFAAVIGLLCPPVPVKPGIHPSA